MISLAYLNEVQAGFGRSGKISLLNIMELSLTLLPAEKDLFIFAYFGGDRRSDIMSLIHRINDLTHSGIPLPVWLL